MFLSCGTIEITDHGLRLLVDNSIVHYYRTLIPKNITINPQRHPAHISIIRNTHEDQYDKSLLPQYSGERVSFEYEGTIYNGKVYWWLNAYSQRLETIRTELGLPVTSWYTRPPGDYKKCFHITIGNNKA